MIILIINSQVDLVGQVASNILRRGVELRYYKLFPPIKNSTLIPIQVPSSFKDGFLNNNSN